MQHEFTDYIQLCGTGVEFVLLTNYLRMLHALLADLRRFYTWLYQCKFNKIYVRVNIHVCVNYKMLTPPQIFKNVIPPPPFSEMWRVCIDVINDCPNANLIFAYLFEI